MSYFLAVDAGGTKADFVLADETRQVARVRSGTIKRMRADAATAALNLDGALTELTSRTGVAMSAIQRTCIGTAGETVPLVANWLREAFAARVSGELLLLGDVEIALDAAFPGQPGVLVLAGTGSNVAARDHSGKLLHVGGWGPVLADQGSGNRIGSEALRAIFRTIDEAADDGEAKAPTALLPAVLEFWGLASIEHLVEFANSNPWPDFSRLVGLVHTCADRGDAVAQHVLQQQGQELAHVVSLAIRRVQRIAPEAEYVPPIAFAGSILENVSQVRDALLATLRKEFPSILTPSGVVDPIDGALWRARALPQD